MHPVDVVGFFGHVVSRPPGQVPKSIQPPTERRPSRLRQGRAWVSLMMRPYSSSTWTMISVGAALMRLASIGTLFWSSLMP